MAKKTHTCTCCKTAPQPNFPAELFPTSGRLGDTVYYQVDGKQRKRKVGNMDRHRFQTDPVFENSRNAKDEFTAAIHIATSIRQALNPFARELGKWPLHNRLTAAVHQKLKGAPGIRGRKELPITQMLQSLRTFQFSEKATKSLRDYAHLRTSTVPMLGTQEVQFELLSPNHRQPIPKYVTHIRPVCITMALSDFKWDGRAKKYKPQNPHHGARAIQYGPLFALKGNRPDQTYPPTTFDPIKIHQNTHPIPTKSQKGLALLTAIALEYLELDKDGNIHRTTTASLEIITLTPVQTGFIPSPIRRNKAQDYPVSLVAPSREDSSEAKSSRNRRLRISNPRSPLTLAPHFSQRQDFLAQCRIHSPELEPEPNLSST